MTGDNILEGGKSRLWQEVERRYGVTLPQGFRDHLERECGRDGVNPRSREDVRIFLSDLKGVIQFFLENVRYFQDGYYLRRLFSSRPPSRLPPTGKKYQRCFEKRLHLVDFVVGRRLTQGNVLKRSLALHKRYKWKQICGKWNEAHPHDRMTPEILKATFYRAVRDQGLQSELLARKERQYLAQFRGALSKLPNYDGRWDSWDFKQLEGFSIIDEASTIQLTEIWFPVPLSSTSGCTVNLEGKVTGPISVKPLPNPRVTVCIDKEGRVVT